MPSQVDPQVAAALAAAEGSAGIPAPAPGDWKALRARANAGQAYLASLIAPSANVTISTCAAAATDGTPVGLRWYTRRGPAPGSAVIYAHGGRPCPGPGIAIAAVHWTCVRQTPVTISQAPLRNGSSACPGLRMPTTSAGIHTRQGGHINGDLTHICGRGKAIVLTLRG